MRWILVFMGLITGAGAFAAFKAGSVALGLGLIIGAWILAVVGLALEPVGEAKKPLPDEEPDTLPDEEPGTLSDAELEEEILPEVTPNPLDVLAMLDARDKEDSEEDTPPEAEEDAPDEPALEETQEEDTPPEVVKEPLEEETLPDTPTPGEEFQTLFPDDTPEEPFLGPEKETEPKGQPVTLKKGGA